MKKTYIYLSFLGIILAFSSCTERIEVDLDESYTRLVVEGNLSTDTMAHQVILTQTSSYYYNQEAPKVSGAQINISDNLGNTVNLSETEEGIYYTPENYFGIIGRTYELRIDLANEVGGASIYEASSKLEAVAPIDSIRMEYNTQFGDEAFWIVKLYALDPAGVENFYLFNVYRNGFLMTDTLDKVSFTDDQLFDGNYTYGIGVSFFNDSPGDESFILGDEVVLQMGGITKGHYTFLSNVSEATSFQNPLFGGPPANVEGNISNGAFGYFSAYSASYSSIILSEDNIDYVD